MATLVLSSFGAAVGGPLGAAIGGMIGQSLDRGFFGPGARSGPCLGDLSVQTSSYGTQVPKVYGTMRVAGTVVWATDLKESAPNTDGGKGSPDGAGYSYSASFAVALSSRQAVRVKRIWADGKLLRGAAGDFKAKTKYRFYSGEEDQEIDPLIAAREGIEKTPAYRGLALAVFGDFQLADFGNRIPILTFEVDADDGSISLDTILEDASAGAIRPEGTQTISGYAAYGASILDSIQPLIEAFGLRLVEEGGFLVQHRSETVQTFGREVLGCSAQETRHPALERRQLGARDLPGRVQIQHYDAERNYQAGQQQASADESANVAEQIDLPAVLDAPAAKRLAEEIIARRWSERERLVVRLPLIFVGLEPGTLVRLDQDPTVWRVAATRIDDYVVIAELHRAVSVDLSSLRADAGRAIVEPDHPAEPSTLLLLDLPSFGDRLDNSPSLSLAASGGSTPWRAFPVRVEGGGVTQMVRTAALRAVHGTVLEPPGPATSAMLDLRHSVVVDLANSEDWLESRTDTDLWQGANLALIGGELLQFGIAEALGDGRFRLGRLLRGRAGTEWAAGSHMAGEAFVLIDKRALARIDLPGAGSGIEVTVTGEGIGDEPEPGIAVITLAAESLRPPSPVHLRAELQADGSLKASWLRRSRIGWAWRDGVDAPLGETIERYRVKLTGSTGVLERLSDAPLHLFTSTEIAEVGGAALAAVSVCQVGDFAPSRESMASID